MLATPHPAHLSPEWLQAFAACAQLVVAAIAVWVAYQIGRSQKSWAERISRERRRDLFNGVRTTANLSVRLMEDLSGPQGPRAVEDATVRFESLIRALKTISLNEIGDLTLISSLITLESEISIVTRDLPSSARTDSELRVVCFDVPGLQTKIFNSAANVSRRITQLGFPPTSGEYNPFG